jgi:hypothetical protein
MFDTVTYQNTPFANTTNLISELHPVVQAVALTPFSWWAGAILGCWWLAEYMSKKW